MLLDDVSTLHSEILQYLGLHFASTLAVFPNLMVPWAGFCRFLWWLKGESRLSSHPSQAPVPTIKCTCHREGPTHSACPNQACNSGRGCWLCIIPAARHGHEDQWSVHHGAAAAGDGPGA